MMRVWPSLVGAVLIRRRSSCQADLQAHLAVDRGAEGFDRMRAANGMCKALQNMPDI